MGKTYVIVREAARIDLVSSDRQANNDKIPPKITILSPVELITKRSLKTESKSVLLHGIVSDSSGIKGLFFNNKPVMYDAQGKFKIILALEYGINNISLQAVDIKGSSG